MARKIGRVEKGLISNPIPGNKPPADCKIAERADNSEIMAIFLERVQDSIILCTVLIYGDNNLVKNIFMPLYFMKFSSL